MEGGVKNGVDVELGVLEAEYIGRAAPPLVYPSGVIIAAGLELEGIRGLLTMSTLGAAPGRGGFTGGASSSS